MQKEERKKPQKQTRKVSMNKINLKTHQREKLEWEQMRQRKKIRKRMEQQQLKKE